MDDIAALEYIKDNLRIGVVKKGKSYPIAYYTVNGLQEISVVIAIFKKI